MYQRMLYAHEDGTDAALREPTPRVSVAPELRCVSQPRTLRCVNCNAKALRVWGTAMVAQKPRTEVYAKA